MASIYDDFAAAQQRFIRVIEQAEAIVEGAENESVTLPNGEQINTFRESLRQLGLAADAVLVEVNDTASDVYQQAQAVAGFVSEIQGAATSASGDADRAESAAEIAQAVGKIYDSTAAGLDPTTGVADGEYFSVPSAEDTESLLLYRNSGGSAVLITTYASSLLVEIVGRQNYASDRFTLSGYISVTTGGFMSSASGSATPLLPVNGDTDYLVRAYTNANYAHAWYDADQQFISGFGADTTATEVTSVTSPSEARYARLSTINSGLPNAFLRSAGGIYNIELLHKVLGEHNPVLKAGSVTYAATSVADQLDAIIARQNTIITGQSRIDSQLDLITDDDAAFFVNSWAYTKTSDTPEDASPVSIISRDSGSVFTVESGDAVRLHPNGSVVVRDDADDAYVSYPIMSISGDTVAVAGTLPANISIAQTMHEAALGQHLSRMGYLGLADYVVSRIQKYAYKKNDRLFSYHPPVCSTLNFSDPSIYNYDGSELLIPVQKIGGAVSGGYVAGTTDLAACCQTQNSDINVNANPAGKYLSRGYVLRQSAAGAGIEMRFAVSRAAGFIEIPIAALAVDYTTTESEAATTTGRARLEVSGDQGQIFHAATYSPEQMHYQYVDFSGTDELVIRVTLADATPTVINLGGVYGYRKSPDTPKNELFASGDVIAFLGDSWTQFPHATEGETEPLRPNGTPADGMQYLSERMREKLALGGVDVTTLNFGQGGQTSAWGLYWVGEILRAEPKPTHCVVLFGINDMNSRDEYQAGVDSIYDFDPEDMYAQLDKSAGGIQGSVSVDMWFSNLRAICDRLIGAGIKPIVMMPAHTASSTQSQGIQQLQLNRTAAGFSDINAPRES